MAALFLALCIIVPIVELAVIIVVGGEIGVLPTIALLLLGMVAGVALLMYQGRTAWRRFNAALAAGKAPTREVLDGFLILVGAILLIVPGFVSDVFGIFLLLPPTRAGVRAVILRWVQSNIVVGVGTTAYSGASAMWKSRAGGRMRAGGPAAEAGGTAGAGGTDAAGIPYDVEGTAVEVDRDQGRLEP